MPVSLYTGFDQKQGLPPEVVLMKMTIVSWKFFKRIHAKTALRIEQKIIIILGVGHFWLPLTPFISKFI